MIIYNIFKKNWTFWHHYHYINFQTVSIPSLSLRGLFGNWFNFYPSSQLKVDINIQAPFGGGGGHTNGHDAEGEGYEGEEGGEGLENGQQQNSQNGTGAMGFAANLMMKAKSLKDGVTEKSGGLNLGNVQVGSISGAPLSPVTSHITVVSVVCVASSRLSHVSIYCYCVNSR